MRHLIVRQILDLRLNAPGEAFGAQQRLSRFFQEEAAPALERLFDRLAPDGRVLRIDRLEIDLGTLNEAQLHSEETLNKLIQLVEEAIQKALNNDKQTVRPESPADSLVAQWLHFLEFGVLPWFADKALPAGYPSTVLEQLGLDAAFARRLRQLLSNKTSALERLIKQHDNAFVEAVATLLSGKSHAYISRVLGEIEQMILMPAAPGIPDAVLEKPSGIRLRLWKWIMTHTLANRGALKQEVLVAGYLQYQFPATLLQGWAGQSKEAGQSSFPAMAAIWSLPEWPQQLPKSRKPADERPATSAARPAAATENRSEEEPAIPPPDTVRPDRKNIAAKDENAARPNAQSVDTEKPLDIEKVLDNAPAPAELRPDQEDNWWVTNAGLVILQGYLPRFFGNLDLLGADKKFRNHEAQQRGAMLLHYLATGQSEAPEYALLLEKVLCGIPAGMPLDRFVPLHAEELEEAEALLEAVVGHWEVLGKTSPEGLRQGFLTREGQLRRRDDGWLLHVERQTLDILLDRSPFAFSVIKLPWMNAPLRVEW
ncbi:MAG: hypothetical protein JNL02_10260 [Saprospiraceae bacterium]|nr:hypothetical protein [Saprospiraceae bacterium]